jgi:hypothetical protein
MRLSCCSTLATGSETPIVHPIQTFRATASGWTLNTCACAGGSYLTETTGYSTTMAAKRS